MYQISTVVPLKLTQCCTSIISPQERKRFSGKAVLPMVAVGRAAVYLWSQQQCMPAKSLQSCPTLCNPMDCSPPGSPVHGILQARILAQVAMPFSRGSSQLRDQTLISWVSFIGRRILYPWANPGSPIKEKDDIYWELISSIPTLVIIVVLWRVRYPRIVSR